MNLYKICSKCDRELPANTDYFFRHKECKNGINACCKECMGFDFTNKLSAKQPKKGYKFCSKCDRELPATNEYFYNKKTCIDGLMGMCKECRESHRKKYYKENKDRILMKGKEYRDNNKEKCAKASKAWYDKNKGYMAEYQRKYNLKNIAKMKENAKRWKASKRGKTLTNIATNRRRAKKKSLANTLTHEQWEQIKADFGYKCAYCGQTLPLQQEHFKALSKGGEYTHNNIIPACRSCNMSKWNKDFFEWYPGKEFYSKKQERFILNYLNYTEDGKQQLALCLTG